MVRIRVRDDCSLTIAKVQRVTNFLDKPVPDVPTPKTFRGWVAFILAIAAALALLTWVFTSLMHLSVDSQEQQDAEVTQLMSGYSQNGFNFDHGRSNGSMWGNVTMNISDGHGVHACRDISMNTLRNHAPIPCSDGAVIKAK